MNYQEPEIVELQPAKMSIVYRIMCGDIVKYIGRGNNIEEQIKYHKLYSKWFNANTDNFIVLYECLKSSSKFYKGREINDHIKSHRYELFNKNKFSRQLWLYDENW